jgi:hypothetical protein
VPIDAIALAIEPALHAIPLSIQFSLDSIALAIQAIGQPFAPCFFRVSGATIQLRVDAIALAIKPPVDPIAATVEARIDAIPPRPPRIAIFSFRPHRHRHEYETQAGGQHSQQTNLPFHRHSPFSSSPTSFNPLAM